MAPLCDRCEQIPAVVQLPSSRRCYSCFHLYLTRLFKLFAGRNSISGHSPTVAVAVSGSASSLALALLFHHYLNSLHRPPSQSPPQLVIFHLHPPNQPPPSQLLSLHDRLSARLLLHPLPRSPPISDPTDTAWLQRVAIRDILVRMARTEGVDTLLLGGSVEAAAKRVLEDVIMGSGGREGESDVRIVRPFEGVQQRYLVRLVRKEIGSAVWKRDTKGLGGVLEKFVEQVAAGNVASVYNVVRTAAKLGGDGGGCGACNRKGGNGKWCGGCEGVENRGGMKARKELEGLERERAVGREEMRKRIEEFIL